MASLPLITPSKCTVVLVDYQAGRAFAATQVATASGWTTAAT